MATVFKEIKRIALIKHECVRSFHIFADPDADDKLNVRIKTTFLNSKSGDRTTIKDLDKFSSIRAASGWIDKRAKGLVDNEGYIVEVEYSFSTGAARTHDEAAGLTMYPVEPISESDRYPAIAEQGYDAVQDGEYLEYRETNIPLPRASVKRKLALEQKGQWVYVHGRYNQTWLGNKLSFYVEGARYSKKSKDGCRFCSRTVMRFFCTTCNKSATGYTHKACGRKTERNWCGQCHESVPVRARWNGRISLLDKRLHRFPIGLYRSALRFLIRTGYSVKQVEQARPEPDKNRSPMVHGVSLSDRPYQVKTVERMLAKGCGILNLATNAGKTAIAGAFIHKLNQPTLFLVYGRDLLTQQQATLQRLLGEKVGLIGTPLGGKATWDPKKVTVASVSTMAAALKGKNKRKAQIFLNSISCLIVDEAHHAASDTFYKVIMACPAPWRFGLSGTALDRGDQKNIKTVACFGPVIVKVSNAYLIKHGFSMRPNVTMVDIPKGAMQLPDGEEETWHLVQQYGLVECDYRNKAAAREIERYHKAGLSTLVLVNIIHHSKEIIKFLDPSINYKSIHADHPDREQAAHDFKKGTLPVLFSTALFDEGIDIEGIDAIVLAGGGKSTIKLLQRIGRGMRKTIGKSAYPAQGTDDPVFYVTDFADNHHEMLAKHCLERIAIYKTQKLFNLTRVPADV